MGRGQKYLSRVGREDVTPTSVGVILACHYIRYLPRKLLAHQQPGRFDPNQRHVELEVLEYFTRADGLPSAFPKKVRGRFYGEGGASRPPHTETTYSISSVRVPDSMPAATFRIKIPEGYHVLDFIEGKHYIMGPDGEPAPSTPVK